jgi:hypothetical protein
LSSDHLLSGVIAEYYTMNSGSSGGSGKEIGTQVQVSRFQVSEDISELLILRLIHAIQEQPQRPKHNAFLSGFSSVYPGALCGSSSRFSCFLETRKRKASRF